VIGAAGKIGGILRACWPQGFARWQIRQTVITPDWVTLDALTDDAKQARVAGLSDVILCLAGATNSNKHAMADNVALGLASVRAGAAAGARVILCSSAAVYGRTPGLLSETTPPAPLSDYGRTKLQMEEEAAALAADLGVPLTALRIGNVAGSDAALGGWTPACQMDQFPDGATPARAYIGPVTLARVMRAVCLRPNLPPVLNIAAPGLVQMGDLLDAAGLAWTPRPAPDTAIREIALDVTCLTNLIPVAPATPRALADEWRGLKGNAA
jgi:nucleoside-diphosphate-sugar epimerase